MDLSSGLSNRSGGTDNVLDYLAKMDVLRLKSVGQGNFWDSAFFSSSLPARPPSLDPLETDDTSPHLVLCALFEQATSTLRP